MTAPTAASTAAGCAAPDQAAPLPAGLDLERETVITGVVRSGEGEAVAARTSGCSTRPVSSPPRW